MCFIFLSVIFSDQANPNEYPLLFKSRFVEGVGYCDGPLAVFVCCCVSWGPLLLPVSLLSGGERQGSLHLVFASPCLSLSSQVVPGWWSCTIIVFAPLCLSLSSQVVPGWGSCTIIVFAPLFLSLLSGGSWWVELHNRGSWLQI